MPLSFELTLAACRPQRGPDCPPNALYAYGVGGAPGLAGQAVELDNTDLRGWMFSRNPRCIAFIVDPLESFKIYKDLILRHDGRKARRGHSGLHALLAEDMYVKPLAWCAPRSARSA